MKVVVQKSVLKKKVEVYYYGTFDEDMVFPVRLVIYSIRSGCWL
jgi:hypothetical protein